MNILGFQNGNFHKWTNNKSNNFVTPCTILYFEFPGVFLKNVASFILPEFLVTCKVSFGMTERCLGVTYY